MSFPIRFPAPEIREDFVPAHSLLIAFAFFGSSVIAAETSPLSLMEAVRSAEQQAPEIRARSAGLAAAEAAIGPARQLPDPQLVVGVENVPVTGDDAFSLSRDFMTMRKVGVMQQFPRREKRSLRAERAATDADRERALLANEQLSVHEAVAHAWIAVLTAERRVQLLQDLQPRSAAQLDAVTAALTSGRGSAAEAIGARAAMVALDDRLQAAQAERDMARSDLLRWLPDVGIRPLADPPDWLDLGTDPDALVGNIAHHRELLAYDAAQRAASADVALARADTRPDWSVELAYAQRGAQFSNMLSLQFRIDLPLFTKSRQDPLVASKQALVSRIEAERDGALRMHAAELRKTLLTWRSASERVRRYEHELLPLSDDRSDAALAAYRTGRGDLQAALRALDEAIELRLTYTDLQNTLGQAWATLHFAFPVER